MIHLRDMQTGEFADFLAYFIPDYAAEISANYDEDMANARARAQREIKADLPSGVDTPGQTLLCMVRDGDDSDAPVGYLWCKPEESGKTVFISEFYVLPCHRGQGYAKSALIALEAMFAKTGHREARLRVAADNDKAQRQYLAAGYRATGINMRKSFGG
ncbi:GNAT family N-acetyltransferase [Hyphomonas sp.]|uniref:GNAT family N-acetyltransferase n=1 Tax=Hyphomonas sp. TaxID=87 RepID=UPI003F6FE50D